MKTGLAITAALAIALVGGVPAQAATTPTPEPTATAAADPAPTATESPTPTPTPADPAPAEGTATGSGANPSLAEQTAAGNHAMGATVEAEEGPATSQAKAKALNDVISPYLGVGGVLGMDVSGWQPNVDWAAQWANGARFAYIKASEGTYYTSSYFAGQYAGSYNVGMIRGAYHFATPNTTDGATQARFFYAHGGGWSPDGRTLPPLLDIEYATDGSGTCWGLSTTQMSNWIADFVYTMRALTGVNPAIYSTANWWNQCTGSNNTFGAYPLFVARYGTSTPGALPASWVNWTMWQYASSGVFAGDQDIFNGTQAQLQQFALGAQVYPPIGSYDGATLSSGSPFAVSGWAFDQTNLAAAVQVQIAWSTPAGTSTTRVTANGARSDVAAAYPGAGPYHGFTAQAPWSGYGQYGACITAIALPGDSAGNGSLGCKTAFVSAATNTAPSSERVSGADRFLTSVTVSQHAFPGTNVPVAYIASGLDFPDALAAAPAAGVQHGPVLLTMPDTIPASIITELNRLKPKKVIVVGGTTAVSAAAVKQLTDLGYPVTRLGGADRYETSRLIAAYAFPSATTTYAASGYSFADALSAAPVAAKQNRPLILVDSKELDPSTNSFLEMKSIRSVTLVGGNAVIADSWTGQAESTGVTVTRIGGADRFITSAMLASAGFGANSASSVYVASGLAWPDALVSAAAAGALSQPLLLAAPTCVPRAIGDQMVRLGTTSMDIAGGTNVLTPDVDRLAVCY